MTQDDLKKMAADRAVEAVESGMVLGLGTGSTARFVVARIGELLKSGDLRDIVGVPTSMATRDQAAGLGIPLSTLDDQSRLDLAIDGADEVDEKLNLVKGRGGALTREKMVEQVADRFIVVADESKMVSELGLGGAMPVEVVQYCWRHTASRLAQLGCRGVLRETDGQPYVTDNGNYIVDCFFSEAISDPGKTSASIHGIAGVVEHGLFIGMATEVIVAGTDEIRVLAR